MSAPITTPYLMHIEECRTCLQACYEVLEATDATQACHRCLRDCANTLKMAIRLMEQQSPLASRFLVDCAEVCEECARCSEKFDNPHARRMAAVCRNCVSCCRRGSAIDV